MPAPTERAPRRLRSAVLAVLALVVLIAWFAYATQAPRAEPVADSTGAFPWAQAPTGAGMAASSSATGAETGEPSIAVAPVPAPADGAASSPFRADAKGRLITDQPMRQQLEQLIALNEGQALLQRLDAELAGLPAPAAARARELATQMEAYQAAQQAAFPPGQAPLVPEEGLAQLDALQALRASHFGAEAARQMFAEDDAVARRLLELMRQDTTTTLTMAQKAARAQARFDVERGAARP